VFRLPLGAKNHPVVIIHRFPLSARVFSIVPH